VENMDLDNELLKCKNAKQVYDLLKRLKIKYEVDMEMIQTFIDNGTPKTKAVCIWVNYHKTKVFYDKLDKCYTTLNYNQYKIVKTGKKKVIPTCYGYTTETDDYEYIKC
jgi:hypothetical protein